MKYKDGTFYETKLIPFPGYKAIMLFGFIFTKESEEEWDKIERRHEEIHKNQYRDLFCAGLFVDIALLFILLAMGFVTWNLLFLLTIPIFLFYVWYGVNFVKQWTTYKKWHDAYRKVIFERQAYALEDEANLPCEQQTPYTSFSFLKY